MRTSIRQMLSFFFSSRRRHTRLQGDWSSDVCSSDLLPRVLRRFDVTADAAPYVELFFQVTTTIELYPETLDVLNALGHVRTAILSNADHEHVAAWNVTLPVDFILISEAVRAYKPHRLVFQRAPRPIGLDPPEGLPGGGSEGGDGKDAE